MTRNAFAMLGPVEVRAGERTVALGGIRNQRILAALLLDAGRVVSIRRLIDAGWGDNPPSSARAQVQNRVGLLRRLLRTSDLAGDPIATSGSGYRLSLDGWDFDLRRFDEEVGRADLFAAGGDFPRASAALGAALRLWRGPALDGLATPVLQVAAVHLEERRLSTLERRIQLDLDLGRYAELVPELTELTGEHPYREGLHALLMLALYRSGRQAEALRVHQRVRALLADQIGIEPGERLRMVHEAVLRGDESLAGGPPVDRPAVVTSRPAAVPRELPADVAMFTGRQQALSKLDRLLAEATTIGAPVVISAITGTAGVGKTALAVHWAHRVAHWFPDGQLCINLRGYAPAPPMRPIEALGLLLRSLGVRPEQIPLDVAGAAAMYRSLLAGKRVLVVLDNARSAEDVRPLLPGGPGCLVLITSRDRLAGLVARDGVRRLTLDVFTRDEAGTLLERLLGHERVRTESDAVAELADLCAYLPLAVRIAVASLTQRPHRCVAELVTELRSANRLAALAADDDGETAVKSAFDLSYETVPPAAQRLFRLLGLVPGDDVSAPAAAALNGTGLTEVKPLLDRLAGAHLIEERAPDRFAFHDLLRRYANDRATAHHDVAERSSAMDRLYRWYLAEVDGAARELYPETVRLPYPAGDQALSQQPQAGGEARHRVDTALLEAPESSGRMRRQAWLDAERRNLLAAIQHAAQHGPHPAAWLLTDWLRGYLWRRGQLTEWSEAGRVALVAAEKAGGVAGQAAIRHTLAQVNLCLGDHETAVTHLLAAIDLAARAGWSAGHVAALGNLGSVYLEMGDMKQAVDLHRQVLELHQHRGNRRGEATLLNNVGYDYRVMGRLRESMAYLTRAVALFRQLGDEPAGEASALDSLAAAYHDLGRLADARDAGTAALALIEQTAQTERRSAVAANLAAIHADSGHHDEASDLADESLRLAREIGERRAEAYALNAVAVVHAARGETGEAARWYEQALEAIRGLNFPYPRIVAMLGVAGAYVMLGRHDVALDRAWNARDAAGTCGFVVLENLALTTVADALARAGRSGEAVGHARTALHSYRRIGHRLGEARALAVLGRLSESEAEERHAARALYAEIGASLPADLRDPAPF